MPRLCVRSLFFCGSIQYTVGGKDVNLWHLSQLHYSAPRARTGNLSQAARELFVTQPNLSRSIAGWRRSWGSPLFEHRKGKVVLNEYGRIFLSGVENVFGELNTCMQTVQRLYENSQKMLSLGCSIDGFLPDVLQSFSRVHPEIGIRQFQGGAHPAGPAVGGAHPLLAVTPGPSITRCSPSACWARWPTACFSTGSTPCRGIARWSWPSWRANP